MKKKLKRTGKKSSFINGSFKRYVSNSTPAELVFDWVYPFIISVIVILIIIILDNDSKFILNALSTLNDVSINIIAILAGFNTASLAIIASTNRSIFKDHLNSPVSDQSDLSVDGSDLKEDIPPIRNSSLIQRLTNFVLNNNTNNKLEITLSFFSYAVISQLSILVIGIAINLLLDSLSKTQKFIFPLNNNFETIGLFLFGACWMTIILHAIFISIRNVDMIYHFIIYKDEGS